MLDLLHILYIAITQSLFVQVTLFVILYTIGYLDRMPKKNWYGYEDINFSKKKKESINPGRNTLFLDNSSRESD